MGACILALSVGFYLYAMAMCKCIKQNLFAVSRNSQVKIKRAHIGEQLIEFIGFHSRVKQLSLIYVVLWGALLTDDKSAFLEMTFSFIPFIYLFLG